jgi:hypothetical protein
MSNQSNQSNPVTITGTLKVWTSSAWRKIDYVLARHEAGEADEAFNVLSVTNSDMSECQDWAEVGEATVTVKLYPHDKIVSKELDGLKTQLQAVRAENQQRENAILDRISKLQAIDFEGGSHDAS